MAKELRPLMTMRFPSNNPDFDPGTLQIGHTVRLCSSGPLMTVSRIVQPLGLVLCVWFVGFQVHSAWLNAGTIRHDSGKDWVIQDNEDDWGNDTEEIIDYDSYPLSDDDYCDDTVNEPYHCDDDDEWRELVDELTEYSDALVRSNETGWFYDD